MLAGTITVNSVADGNPANDAFITLREALLIARGDRTAFDHPDPDTPDEKRLVAGEVGAGINDTISVTLNPGDTINLVTFLPPLDDAQDSIQADSKTVVNGSALSDADSYAFNLTTANHAINGLTLSNFPGTAIRIATTDITINATLIRNSGRSGIDIQGPASGNTIRNCVVDGSQDFGIVISTGASGNTIHNSFIYNCNGTGIWIYGQGADGNTIYACGIGLKEPSGPGQSVGEAGGNGGDGVKITDGAKNNRIGNPNKATDFTFISNNTLGGIEIKDAGTDGNILHSLWLGVDKDDPTGVGNGSLGHGIEIWDGAKNTQIGIMNQQAHVVLAGHNNSPIYVHGVGTNGTNIQRTFIGGINPTVYPAQMDNRGHGLEIADGVQDMIIGGEEGFGLFVDFVKNALGTRHGVYINGNNASTPIKNITFKALQLGRERSFASEGIIDGDVIHITGNVDGVDIGLKDHDNLILGAKGYGIVLDGPDVRNIRLFDVVIGENFGSDEGCEKGGILITNGAHDITIGYEAAFNYNIIGYNKGHGIHIDARNTAPYNIDVVNCTIGVNDQYGFPFLAPNQNSGIFIEGPDGPPLPLTGINIGQPDPVGLGNTISANTEHGIHLKNVAGVKILNNRIGTPKDGTRNNFTGNLMDGILLDNCKDIIIGDDSMITAGNQISGNKQAGIRFKNRSWNNTIQQNLIGTTVDGQSRFPNELAGIIFEAPGPDSGQTQIIGGASSLVDDSGAKTLDQGNVISGNNGPGVLMEADGADDLARVILHGNLIGISKDGMTALKNEGAGVLCKGKMVSEITLGDMTDSDKGNIISGNSGNGIEIDGVADWKIWNNVIGLDVMRKAAVGNEENGVKLTDTTDGQLGTQTPPHAGNLISGNDKAGIHISKEVGDQVVISHNQIGTDKEGKNAVPNEDGILIVAPNGESVNRLVIGGTSAAIAARNSGDLDQGNLISGNTRDGIRVEAPGGQGDPSIFGLDIFGNLIGVNIDGDKALANNRTGLRIEGGAVEEVFVGTDGDDSKGNLISGNIEEGVLISDEAEHVEIYKNLIGSAIVPDDEIPNGGHGIWIRQGAGRNKIKENIIRFNEKNGIRVSGQNSLRNTFKKNSIHRNVQAGIFLEDNANASDTINTPKIDRIFAPGDPTNGLNGSCNIPNGELEIFVDPVPGSTEDGYYGQGKTFVKTVSADFSGKFVIPLNFPDQGLITATITDDDGNTSAFSPIADGLVIQVVKTDADLLVAFKRTIVRLYGNTGQGTDVTGQLSGNLSINGSGALSATPNRFVMRSLFAYNASTNARLGDRQNARNSLNFYIDKPSGMHEYEITLKEGTRERGKINLGSYEFKEIDSFSVAIVPVIAPQRNGLLPKPYPSLNMAQQAMNYFSSVFPFDPANFLNKMKITPLLNRNVRPHSSAERLKLYREVEKIRARTKLPDGSSPRFAAGLVSVQTRFDPPGAGVILFGSTFGSVPRVIGMLDQNPVTNQHNGNVLLHEIGHTLPFDLGDTYTNASSTFKAINPVDPMPSQANNRGNFILENEFAFAPLNNMQFFNLQGPVFSDLSAGSIIYDFMGNAPPAWADPVTYPVLYNKSLGDLKSSAGIRLTSETGRLLVQGAITIQDVVTLEPVIHRTGPADQVPQQPVGTHYIVELLDGADQVLDAADVWMEFEEHWSGYDLVADEPLHDHPAVGAMPFSVELNDFPGAAKIIVRKDGQILAVLEASANAPTVTLLAPHGPGNLPANEVLVSWSADDADPGDAQNLTFDILYTPDDANTVLPVALGLSGISSATVPTDELPSGYAPRFIICASDGWHETTDQSDPPLTLVDRTPQVQITPLEEMLYDDVATILLATAYDIEDGFILEDTVVWTLNDEPLATGYNPVVILPAGTHILKVTATDSMGNKGSDQHIIEVRLGPNSTACRVGLENFALLAQYWLSDEGGPTADLDGSGMVDFDDLLLIIESWGGLCPE